MALSYVDCIADLYRRQGGGIRLGLGRMADLLKQLGQPQAQLRCVLVAGSNGKGSTARLIAGGLMASGLRVGLYTSPHLLRFAERIRIDGQPISAAAVTAAYPRLQAAAAACAEAPSFFEMATAMALLHFAAAAVDWAVLEVGLGGRLDATNLAPRALTVITPIALDHCALLGDSLAAIAGEKAGIMRAGCPVVVAPQPAAAAVALRQAARAVAAPWIDADPLLPCPGPSWPAYQAVNLATAAAACRWLGVEAAAWARAQAAFDWPGRYQWLEPDTAPTTGPVLLDGAHNPAAMTALLAAMAVDERARGLPWRALVGALADKDVAAMLAPLAASGMPIHLCGLSVRRGLTAAAWRRQRPELPVYPDLPTALTALQRAAPTAPILVTGSLFLVADALAHLTGAARDLPVAG